MTSTLKHPPVLPRALTRFLVFSIGWSLCAVVGGVVADHAIPNEWLYSLKALAGLPDAQWKRVGPVFIIFLLLWVAVTVLGLLALVSCWLISCFAKDRPVNWEQHHQAQLQAVRTAAERHRRNGPTAEQIASRRQAEAEQANVMRERIDREILELRLEAYNRRQAEKAIQVRLTEVERQVLNASPFKVGIFD